MNPIYRLTTNITGRDPDGAYEEDGCRHGIASEWFASQKEAWDKRKALCNYSGSYEISRVWIGEGQPRRRLTIGLLNGVGYIDHQEILASDELRYMGPEGDDE